jgi:hypothetical protein
MKEIGLTQSKVAVISDSDYENVSRFKWHAQHNTNTWYAYRGIKGGKISMHQQILGHIPLGMMTDHYDGNGLNNQRDNLHLVTPRQNQQNLHIAKTSKYPGVGWNKKSKKWVARIKINGHHKYLGAFVSEKEAFQAYKNAIEVLGQAILIK